MWRIRPFSMLLIVLLGLAACETNIPAPPQVTVNITAVSVQDALDDAVALALTGTAERVEADRLTQMADSGITLTPSSTPTATLTPLPPTETPYLSPTPTPTPTSTPTPTFAPLPSLTPNPMVGFDTGRIRFLHAWRTNSERPVSTVDVYIDDVPVAREMNFGDQTDYQAVRAATVRVSIKEPVRVEGQAVQPPVASLVVDVPPGGSVSVVIANMWLGPELISIHEEVTPLASGQTRLNVLHANTALLRSNLLVPGADYVLAEDVGPGDSPGPFDLPSGVLPVWLYDAEAPAQLIVALEPLQLDTHVNYLLVLVPAEDPLDITGFLLFRGSTQPTAGDTGMRFMNAAINAGALSVFIDGELVAQNLAVGQRTVTLPFSRLGGNLRIENSEGDWVYNRPFGPWEPDQNDLNKIVLLRDAEPTDMFPIHVEPEVFFEEPPASLTRANIRLIHGLAGVTRTLDLEIRSTNPSVIENPFGIPQNQQADTTWSPVAQNVSFGFASSYVVRNPNVFDVRLLLSGSATAQASLTGLQFLPGGVYHFIALPGGPQLGVARLILLQPEPQTSLLSIDSSDSALIQERVEAVLTASAPAVTATPTSFNTPTPTISPVPTNTPRPSSTPLVAEPQIRVDPAPPNTVTNVFVLRAENFAPGTRYTIRINDRPENISGSIGEDGTLLINVDVPRDLPPGLHFVRLCADCRLGGAQQERMTLFRVPDPARTATPTPDR